MSDGAIGLFLLIVAAGTIALQLPLGWISDHKDRRFALLISCTVGTVTALYVFYGVGSMLGPLIVSQFMAQFGPRGLHLFMACVMGLYIPFGLFRLRSGSGLPGTRNQGHLPYNSQDNSYGLQDVKKTQEKEPQKRKII
ncbi:hypothetical protein [Marispirochaeta aestuarii]|uniref:hypothetical protein n=1 Tax=Marispirochaeta aestuarii TaxID=1963862 RepID=UPI0029C981E9|nr:hypothetical protein [Marispirochaeta aestuarii]